MSQISVLYPENCRQIAQIPKEGLLIGRAPFCDLQLLDEFVSASHCKIYPENGILFIEDLNSTNGTFIDGTEIKKKSLLQPGQNVQIGIAVLKVV
jgi:pSer/pThr/pTyr-binding forkhead associated (FHA) protein